MADIQQGQVCTTLEGDHIPSTSLQHLKSSAYNVQIFLDTTECHAIKIVMSMAQHDKG